jgi:hypothetical protein
MYRELGEKVTAICSPPWTRKIFRAGLDGVPENADLEERLDIEGR